MKPLLLCAVLLAFAPVFAQQPDLLDHSIVGSESCDSHGPCYDDLISKLPVQKFFLQLAASPMPVSVADAELKSAGVSAGDLLALRLMRRQDDKYLLNFPLFTASDVARIRGRSEVYASSLAAAVLERRGDIDAALAAYDAPGVDRRAVAYFLLGCVSLDWDGLEITAARKYRAVAGRRPDGDYVPAAEEKTAQSLQGIYWGSNNSRFAGVGFTSFGDHFSRRYAFPDLVWTARARIAARPGDPEGAQQAVQALVGASLQSSAGIVGRTMLALRDGEKTAEQVAAATSQSPEDAKDMLEALRLLAYVSASDGRYRAAVPVLDARDRAMSDRLRQIGREVMERWLAANYPRVRSEMSDLAPGRAGVPFEESFTMVWHYIFGIANRKLVEAGLFADPYAPGRTYKGSIPAVYSLEYSLDF